MRTLIWVWASLVVVAGVVGCGAPEDRRAPSPAGTPGARQIDTKNLPRLGDPMAPLDEGRLEVAPPENWHVPPRRPRWLARFQADSGSPYPVIFVTAEDADAVLHVTRDNLGEFAAAVRNELLADPGTQRLAADLQPVVVGGFRGTLYRRWGKSDGRVMERWMLETAANGRRYTLELRSREGLADEYLPHLYAVASGLQFFQAEDAALTAAEETPEETTDEDPPEADEVNDEDEDDVDAP